VHHDYADIRSRIEDKPSWFDEHGVPRYGKFEPRDCANIYASEVVLLLIMCQRCQHQFLVCMSWSQSRRALYGEPSLTDRVKDGSIHYGDPPNVACCPAGPTMNSVPRQVAQFWTDDGPGHWYRRFGRERPISCDWYEDSEGGGA